MISSKELWSIPSSSSGGPNGNRAVGNGSNSYGYMASNSAGMMQMQGVSNGAMQGSAVPHDRSQEICKYFINGGCLRGSNCPYLHELPDERHLDVNGLGFILNPNVHNAQKTVSTTQTSGAASAAQGGQLSPNSQGSPIAHTLGNQQNATVRQFQFNKTTTRTPFSMLSPPATVTSPVTIPSNLAPPPRYRPPEPYLEHNLPPVLALPMKLALSELSASLAYSILEI